MSKLSAVAELLDRDSLSDSLREWADILSVEQKQVENDHHSILVFRIGSEWMGIETSCIEEVAEAGVMRRLPHRNGSLAHGIVSLRGEIFVCISLEILLGLKELKQDSVETLKALKPRLVVCKTEAGKFAFVATEVQGVERYLHRDLRPAPSTISKSSKNYTTGILTWNDRITIGCLDTGRLLASIDKGVV